MLLSVFVPTTFIPGITGKLYQQFAVAVSVSMIISAFNALTLSPALCALCCATAVAAGLMAYLQRGIDKGRDGYIATGAAVGRHALITGPVGRRLRRGDRLAREQGADRFPARRDQGAFMAEVQLPEAASLNRTSAVLTRVEGMIEGRPWAQNIFSVEWLQPLDDLDQPEQRASRRRGHEAVRREHRTIAVGVCRLRRTHPQFDQIASATSLPSTCRR